MLKTPEKAMSHASSDLFEPSIEDERRKTLLVVQFALADSFYPKDGLVFSFLNENDFCYNDHHLRSRAK